MDPTQLQDQVGHAARLLKALSNPHRLLILCQLLEGEKAVGELVALIGLSQSALSQHLARLRRDKLVRTRRVAQTIFYAIEGAHAHAILATLHELYCGDLCAERKPALATVGVPPQLSASRANQAARRV